MAGGTGHRGGAGVGAGTVAARADDGRVDLQWFGDPESGLGQGELEFDKGVLTITLPRDAAEAAKKITIES